MMCFSAWQPSGGDGPGRQRRSSSSPLRTWTWQLNGKLARVDFVEVVKLVGLETLKSLDWPFLILQDSNCKKNQTNVGLMGLVCSPGAIEWKSLRRCDGSDEARWRGDD